MYFHDLGWNEDEDQSHSPINRLAQGEAAKWEGHTGVWGTAGRMKVREISCEYMRGSRTSYSGISWAWKSLVGSAGPVGCAWEGEDSD